MVIIESRYTVIRNGIQKKAAVDTMNGYPARSIGKNGFRSIDYRSGMTLSAHFLTGFAKCRIPHHLALEHPPARQPPLALCWRVFAHYQQHRTVGYNGDIDTGDWNVRDDLIVELLGDERAC